MNTNSRELPVLRFMTESGSEDVHYPLMYEGFPEEFKILAEEELKESEEKKLNGLQVLRDHIKRKNLHQIPDYLLLATLRACKYDIKKSKNKLEKLISKRKEIVDMLVKTGLKKVEVVMDNFSCGMLPYRDKHGSVIFYTRPDGFDLDLHCVDDVGTACLLMVLFTFQFPITTVSGASYFVDCKHSSLTFVYPTVKALKRFMWHPLSLPIRASKVNVLNLFSVAYWFYKITSPLLPEKIRKMLSLPIRASKVNVLNLFSVAYWIYKLTSPLVSEKIRKRLSLPIRASKVNILNLFSVAYWFYKITSTLVPEKIRKRLSLPIRASKVNVLNLFSVAYWFYKITSTLVPDKIRKRIYFLPKGYEVLQKEYNKNILPEEFGGIAGPLSNSQYKENVLEFARKLIAEYG